MPQEQMQEPKPPVTPLIIQYQQQLAAFIQQRDQIKIQFEQLQGAIFACENMIKQYHENAKNESVDSFLKMRDNLGAIHNDEAKQKSTEEVA